MPFAGIDIESGLDPGAGEILPSIVEVVDSQDQLMFYIWSDVASWVVAYGIEQHEYFSMNVHGQP